MSKRLLFPALAATLALTAAALVAELAVRAINPTPRVQVFRPGDRTGAAGDRVMVNEGGIPTWTFPDAAPRYNLDCPTRHPNAPRVLVLGSSIFAGVSIEPERVFTRLLDTQLFPGEPVCVLNLAEPAYSFQNQAQVLRKHIEALQPDLIVWEMWSNSPWPYQMVGDTAYRFHSLIVGEDGTPNPLRTWPPLHRWLLPRSRVYELTVLTLATELHPAWNHRHVVGFTAGELRTTLRWVTEELQVPVLAVFCPKLDRSFEQQRDGRGTDDDADAAYAHYRLMDQALQAIEVPTLHLDERFIELGVTPEQVRLDPCCHYNEAGQQVLVDAIAPTLRAMLRPPAP